MSIRIMSVALNPLPLVVSIFPCIEKGRVRLFFTLLSLLVLSPTLVKATTYYVAPNGSNSSTGTQAAPFATLQAAHNVANAGDTIYMRAGLYNISVTQTLSRDGTSGNPIKVFNYPGEIPILDGSSITGADGTRIIKLSSASWWHIKGIEMKNNPRGGGLAISDASTNNIIEGNNVHHNGRRSSCCAPGIAVYNTSSNNLILNNDSHHNRDSTNGNADGIGISGVTRSGNVVRGNRVWRNSDDGVDLWNSANVTIENNWAFENGLDDNLQPLGNGQGFKLGGAGAGDGRHMVRNNLSWKNKSNGFDYNSADLPITLYNNTAWNNRGSNYIFRNVQNIFRNNVSFGSLGSISGSDTFNSWTLGVSVSAADFASLDDACARGPRNTDGSLPNCNFLHLATGSDLIDRGTDVGIAYVGSAPDLGAYEYGGGESGANNPPSFVVGPNQTVGENAGPQTVSPWATAIDDGDPAVTQALTFNITGNTNPSLFSAGPSVSPTGVLTYTPATNASGTATITLTLSDDGGTPGTPGDDATSPPQTFTITVNAANNAPTFVVGPNQSVNEDSAAQTVSGWATAIDDGDPESTQTVTFIITGNTHPEFFSAQPSVSPTGTLAYTPAPNAFGSSTITLVLQDDGGTANPGDDDTSDPQSFTITINAVNDEAPVCGDNNVTLPEQCDDGNTTDGDGCSATCTNEGPPATNRLR